MSETAEFPVDCCRSCSAGVIWAVSENNRSMPIDAEPAANGSVRLEPRGELPPRAIVVKPDHLRFGRTDLRTPHHLTCPQGPSWRKRGKVRR